MQVDVEVLDSGWGDNSYHVNIQVVRPKSENINSLTKTQAEKLANALEEVFEDLILDDFVKTISSPGTSHMKCIIRDLN